MPTVTRDVTSSAVIDAAVRQMDVATRASIQPSIPFLPADPVLGKVVVQEVALVGSVSGTGGFATNTSAVNIGEDVPVGSVLILVLFNNEIISPVTGITDTKGNAYSIATHQIGRQGSDQLLNSILPANDLGTLPPPSGSPGNLGIMVLTCYVQTELLAGADQIQFQQQYSAEASQGGIPPAGPLCFGAYYENVPLVTADDVQFVGFGNDPLLAANPVINSFLIDSGTMLALTDHCIVVGAVLGMSPVSSGEAIIGSGTQPWDLTLQNRSETLFGHYISFTVAKEFQHTDGSFFNRNYVVTEHFFDPVYAVVGFGTANLGDLIRVDSLGQQATQFQALVLQLRVPQRAAPLDVQTVASIRSPFHTESVTSSAVIGRTTTRTLASSAAIGVSSETGARSLNITTFAIIE